MSKVSNRIKKYAIKNFDFHLDESVYMNVLDQALPNQTFAHQDSDIKIRDAPIKLVKNTSQQREAFNLTIQQINPKNKIVIQSSQNTSSYQTNGPKTSSSQNRKNNKKNKMKTKKFIELQGYNKIESEKNTVDQKIQKMRKNKIDNNEKQKKRSLFFSLTNQNYIKRSLMQTSFYRKNDISSRRQRKNDRGYIPIGYNGQRLQKKVSKQSDLIKYNNHFVDMQISISSGAVSLYQNKQNHTKKQNVNYNIFQRLREKKANQILNSKNVHVAVFRTYPKKVNEQQKKQQFQRKLESFVNKNDNNKVQLTLRQLMQFKQLVYRKRQEQYFRVLRQAEVTHQKLQKQVGLMTTKKISTTNLKQNVMKKQQINIQNRKNYQQLLNAADFYQNISISNHEQRAHTQKGKLFEQKVIKLDNNSFHIRNKTARKQYITTKNSIDI